MDTNALLLAFGVPTVVTFIAAIWYWVKRSQEVLPPMEKKIEDLSNQNLELTYKLKSQDDKIENIVKDIDNIKTDKKKIYDVLDAIKESQASEKSDMKNLLRQVNELTTNFNSLQKTLNDYLVNKAK